MTGGQEPFWAEEDMEGCQGQTSEPLHLLNYTDSPSVVHGRLGPARDPVRRLLHQQCFHNKIMMLFAVFNITNDGKQNNCFFCW